MTSRPSVLRKKLFSWRNKMRIPGVIVLPPNRVWRTYLGGRTLDVFEKKEARKIALIPRTGSHPRRGLTTGEEKT
jgi:hypothetical protein